jgi:YfiH family protein
VTARLVADWPAPACVHAFTTLRHGAGHSRAPFDAFNLGNRHAPDGDDPRVVERNRSELIERFALPSEPRWLRQVHGTAVVHFDAAVVGAHPGATDPCGESGSRPGALLLGEPEADAAVTSTPGTVLAILTADCLPVVFAADDGSEVGAAHAGWRGLAAGVLENTVAAMQTAPERLLAWLGPAAGPQAYEIGEEVRDTFLAHDARAVEAFVATNPGHWRVDLYALARKRLADAGVTRVHGGGLCTISDPQRFYSHRRDRRTGRMATLVWSDTR